MSDYNRESLQILFTAMRLDTSDDNVLSLLKAGEAALRSPTYSEALRTLSFAWDCAGVPQPAATYHAAIMLDSLIQNQSI